MDLINFFLNDNKSGYKTTERYLKKNYFDLYNEIINYSEHISELPLKQRIWHYIYDVKNIPCCNNCGDELKFGRSLNEGYGLYCSIDCTNKSGEHIEKVRQTNNVKYGGNSPISSNEIKDKISKTNIEKYGVDNIFKDNQYIQDKIFEKHGVNSMNKLPEVKQKRLNTNIERYGVSTTLLLDDSRKVLNKNKLDKFINEYSDYEIINGVSSNIEVKCDQCSSKYFINRSTFVFRVTNEINPCTICNPIGEQKSIKEKELGEFLTEIGCELEVSDRAILDGREIDIFIPKLNIGIEFNGLYYHSSLFKDSSYHINKTTDCQNKGIRLIHVFEDEWDSKKEIVKSRLKVILNKVENKIYGRKCVIKVIGTKTKTKFLNDNHIQGAVGSSVNIGLIYNGELVSIMTFGKKRRSLGYTSTNSDEYELLRFCNKLNHVVVGGASKLLNYFIKSYKPKEIISYADLRWSDGNLYEKLGFEKIKLTTPNYFYIINRRRVHRYKFRKDILVNEGFDEKLTENEIMEQRGIYKIYDCGNLLYKLNFDDIYCYN